jgi:hypothetical protein
VHIASEFIVHLHSAIHYPTVWDREENEGTELRVYSEERDGKRKREGGEGRKEGGRG